MARRSTLRASDADREHVAERLRHAAGEGRLMTEELEDRLGGVFSARTYGQLNALVADLPIPRQAGGHRLPLWVRAGLGVALVLGVLAAVAIAAALLTAILCLWMVWMVVSWRLLGRRPTFLPARPGRLAGPCRR